MTVVKLIKINFVIPKIDDHATLTQKFNVVHLVQNTLAPTHKAFISNKLYEMIP